MLSDVGYFFVAHSPSSAVFCCVDPIFIDVVAAFGQIFSLVLNLFEEFVDVIFPSFPGLPIDLLALNENDNDGRMAILMVTGYAKRPCAKELRRKDVKQSRARCPTYNRKNETC